VLLMCEKLNNIGHSYSGLF